MNRKDLNKLSKVINRQVGRAVMDYSMIKDGDRIMACLSGGADSFTMLDALLHLQRVAPINFSIIAVNLDQKQPGFPEHVLPEYLKELDVEYKIIEKDTYSIVKDKIPEGEKTCWLCSRLRRGILYNAANALGATKVALGHHADDIVETMFLNMIHGATLKAMPPKLLSDDKRNIVIRPLAYCREKDIKSYSAARKFPIIPCNLCGSQENLKRQETKAMLMALEKTQPEAVKNMLTALTNVAPSQLADRKLYDFNNLEDQIIKTNPDDYIEKTTSNKPSNPSQGDELLFVEL